MLSKSRAYQILLNTLNFFKSTWLASFKDTQGSYYQTDANSSETPRGLGSATAHSALPFCFYRNAESTRGSTTLPLTLLSFQSAFLPSFPASLPLPFWSDSSSTCSRELSHEHCAIHDLFAGTGGRKYSDWLSLGDVPTSGIGGSYSTFLETHGLRMGKRGFHKGELVPLPKGKGRVLGRQDWWLSAMMSSNSGAFTICEIMGYGILEGLMVERLMIPQTCEEKKRVWHIHKCT